MPISRINLIFGTAAVVGVLGGCAQEEVPAEGNSVEATEQQDLASLAMSTSDHCDAVMASVEDAGFSDRVTVTCDDENAYIYSDSFPNHPVMTGIVGTNEQIPVPTQGFYAPIKLDPELAEGEEPKTRDSSVAIAINGIAIFDYSAAGELSIGDLYTHQPHLDTLLLDQLDSCGGHTGRGDDYHYHVKPTCMIEEMANKDDNPIIGWAFDGFPLYGDNNPDGTEIPEGTLDVCNGQPDSTFGYRYHTSDEPPYITQCLVGVIGDLGEFPRIGTTRQSGLPPEGGVDDLVFTEMDDGSRTMTYSYRGEDYYLKAAPTGEENCYDFEYKTVTNGGVVETGEHCTRVNTGPDNRDTGAPPIGAGAPPPLPPGGANPPPPPEGTPPPPRDGMGGPPPPELAPPKVEGFPSDDIVMPDIEEPNLELVRPPEGIEPN